MDILTPSTDDDELIKRAVSAYFKHDDSSVLNQPSRDCNEVRDVHGRRYVVLANGYRDLAAYRIRPNGELRRVPDHNPLWCWSCVRFHAVHCD